MAKELLLYDDIGGWGTSSADFVSQIQGAGNDPIDLRINSTGGSVFEGYAIYNALKRHAPGVTVYVDGLAASIASYIAMAGQKVYMAKNAMLMIHKPSGGNGGTAEEMRRNADILDQLQASLVDAYSSKTGIPADEISKMLDEETWLDADQALAFGFADELTPELAMAAKLTGDHVQNFKKVPDAFKSAVWTTAYINNLADSAFLHIEAGGKKDGEGKTTPRSLRHFPYKDSSGKIDLPHLRNALARIPQSNLPDDVKKRLTEKATKLLKDNEASSTGQTNMPTMPNTETKVTVEAAVPAAKAGDTPATTEKPSIFARVAGWIKDNSSLVNEIEGYKAQVEARDKAIVDNKAFIDQQTATITKLETEITQFKDDAKKLEDAFEALKKEQKTVAQATVDQVAALGFEEKKLPPVMTQEQSESPQALLERFNAIKDPVERSKFLRENKEAIQRANTELKKKPPTV